MRLDAQEGVESVVASLNDVSAVNLLSMNLRLLERNNRLIANNIANVDTPNFRPSHIDFQRTLKLALRDGFLKPEGERGGRTSRKPLRIVYVEDSIAGRNDGNHVDMESEMTGLAVNTGRYNLFASLLKKRFEGAKGMLTRLR